MNIANSASAIKDDIGVMTSDSFDDDDTDRDVAEELEDDLDQEIEKLHGRFDQLMGTGDFAPKTKPSGPRGARAKSGRPAARR